MNPDRKRRRQEHRRAKRDVLQNDLVLKGWVPVKDGADYGVAHVGGHHLVMRRRGTKRWCYIMQDCGLVKWLECSWNEMQAQWMRGLRAVVIQKGWL